MVTVCLALILVLLAWHVLSLQVVQERELGRFRSRDSFTVRAERHPLERIVAFLGVLINGRHLRKNLDRRQVSTLSFLLRAAGLDGIQGYTEYLVVQACALSVWPFLVYAIWHFTDPIYAVCWSLISFGGCSYFPRFWLQRRASHRCAEIEATLPVAITALNLTLQSGVRQHHLFAKVMEAVRQCDAPEFYEDLKRVHRRLEAGYSWKEAFEDCANRIDDAGIRRIYGEMAVLFAARGERQQFHVDQLEAAYDERRAVRQEQWFATAPIKALTICLVILFCCFTVLVVPALV